MQRKHQAGYMGRNSEEPVQVSRKRKGIVYDAPPYQEIGKLSFRMGRPQGKKKNSVAWEGRLRELAEYRKIQGHCNVPTNYIENPQLAKWVADQRTKYKLRVKGKTSPMTLSRIKELESLGFEWGACLTAWEDRLGELADYRKIHGHCNVPARSSGKKTFSWVLGSHTKGGIIGLA
jgi:hypothetical protein